MKYIDLIYIQERVLCVMDNRTVSCSIILGLTAFVINLLSLQRFLFSKKIRITNLCIYLIKWFYYQSDTKCICIFKSNLEF
jgi:hypothetical protein